MALIDQQQYDDSDPPNDGSSWNKSFKICSVFGIPIRVHILLPLFLVFMIVIWSPLMLKDTANIGGYFLLILLYNVSLWETVLVHELGHALGGYLVGGRTHRVLLWPLGGLAFTQPPSQLDNAAGDAQRRKHHIIISLAGPLTHIPHLVLYTILLQWYCESSTPFGPSNCPYNSLDGNNPFTAWIFWQQTLITNCDGEGKLCFWYNFLMLSFMLNFWLLMINLFVPAYPLDGSKVFVSCLQNKYDLRKTVNVYCWVTGIIAAICIIVGGVLFRSNTLLFFIGVWSAFQVYQMYMLVQSGQAGNHPLFA